MQRTDFVSSRRLLLAGLFLALAGLARAEDAKPAGEAAADKTAADQPAIDPAHPLYKPLEYAYKSRAALKDLKDYQAYFIKKEAIGGPRMKETRAVIKLRDEPFSVYLKFDDANKGREVIFVQGKNNNQLLVHEAGIKAIAGTISLNPNAPQAMDGNKYPITMIGMKKMLDKIITQWEKEGKLGETEVRYFPDAKLGEIPCLVIESTHPQKRDEFTFQKTMLYLDKQTNYPIRVEQHAFPGKVKGKGSLLVEEYTYSDIKANLGLKDQDFDHTNPTYAFPK